MLDVKKEIKLLDNSLVQLKAGLKSVSLNKKDKKEIFNELKELISLAENAK